MNCKEFCKHMDIINLLNQGLSHSVIITNGSGQICFFNKTSEKLFKMSFEETRGKIIGTLIKNLSSKKTGIKEFMNSLSSNGKTSVCFKKSILIKKNGEEFPARVSLNRAYSKEGELSFILFIHDSTEEQKKTATFVREMNQLVAM